MPFKFSIPNLSEALAKIDTYSKEAQANVDAELTATAYNVQREAQSLAPVNDGKLRTSIQVIRDEPMQKEIEAGAEHSAYVEFGTGTNVSIPEFGEGLDNLVEYAAQFKGAGKQGRHPVKFKDGTWRLVPYQLNLPARPYFFPALQSNTVELPKRLKEILER